MGAGPDTGGAGMMKIIAIIIIMAVAAGLFIKALISADREFEIEDEMQVKPWRYEEGDDAKK